MFQLPLIQWGHKVLTNFGTSTDQFGPTWTQIGPNVPIWAHGRIWDPWARAWSPNGPGPNGPLGPGPWSQWAPGPWPLGPGPVGPWTQCAHFGTIWAHMAPFWVQIVPKLGYWLPWCFLFICPKGDIGLGGVLVKALRLPPAPLS